MPNLSPTKFREGYQLYDHKPGLNDDPFHFGLHLEEKEFNRGEGR